MIRNSQFQTAFIHIVSIQSTKTIIIIMRINIFTFVPKNKNISETKALFSLLKIMLRWLKAAIRLSEIYIGYNIL